MINSWTKSLDKKDATIIKEEFISSKIIRNRLEVLLKDKIEQRQKESRTKDLYDNPNWAYLQADSRGYERALEEIIKLIA